MRSEEEIVTLMKQRREFYAPVHAKMRELEKVYDGDTQTDMPEMHDGEKPAVPNLVSQGIDQLAMRVASTSAQPVYPPLRPGNKDSERYSRIRRDVTLAWWSQNRMKLKVRKRARDLIGLAISPVLIGYDQTRDIPVWNLKRPDETLPAPGDDVDSITPPDCMYLSRRPYWWLLQEFPDKVALLRTGDKPKRDELFELVHYVDQEQSRLIVLGKTVYGQPGYGMPQDQSYGASLFVTLVDAENRTGLCPAVTPGRITLGRLQSAFMTVLGLYQRQGRMMALEELALYNSVFPAPYLQSSDPTIVPKITTPANGRTGQVGVVQGGTITTLNEQPSLAALNAVDRGERAIRTTVGLPADFGGESASNVRTGRRGDSIVAAATDFNIQENQELLEVSLMEEDRRAIALDKVYGGDRQKLVNVAWKGAKGPQTYIPLKHWETDAHAVRYAMAGADATSLNIAIAQKVGTGLMSRETGMELDSMIDDAEAEKRRLAVQKLDDAGLDAVAGQMRDGTIVLTDGAAIKRLIMQGKSWDEAVDDVQKAAQERQSTTVEPVQPGSPEAMPGLGAAGMGAEAGALPAVLAPPPSLDNLARVLSQAQAPARVPQVA